MISLTPYGSKQFQDAVNALPAKVHLFTDSGELTGHGYSPKRFSLMDWQEGGQYPEFMWVFDAESQPSTIMGYYITDASKQVLFSDTFDEPNVIQNQGDRIGVSIKLRFMGALGA